MEIKQLNINYFQIKQSEYSKALTNKYISKATYYKINFPSFLQNFEKIIYLDVDIINFKDLTELYRTNLKDNIYIGGILDSIGILKDVTKLGVPAKFTVNGGVLLMNIKSFVKYNITDKINNFIKSHFLNHHDQNAINAICFNHTKILPLKYNVQKLSYKIGYEKFKEKFKDNQSEYGYKDDELMEAFHKPVNIHFTGYDKPWDKKYSPCKEFWWYYANKTKYMKEIMKYYKHNETEIKIILSMSSLINSH